MSSDIETRYVTGADQVQIAVSIGGNPAHQSVILVHGGGQTRHAWKATQRYLLDAGFYVAALDLRGHGDSDWATDSSYSLSNQIADLKAVIATMPNKPVLVGASLGGLIALTTIGETPEAITKALILVDVTPIFDEQGERRIVGFMQRYSDGFASLEEAADAVAAYNPGRPRPKDPSGLARNLRQRGDRFYWHWDPALFDTLDARAEHQPRFEAAARHVHVPTLLVRGAMSDLVLEEHIKHFLEIIPQASYVDVGDAGHMIVGDKNDAFRFEVSQFLHQLDN